MAKGPLGKFVAERRKALNLRQSDLADALGYTTQAISKFEAGESQIAIAVLPNLANLLHLSIDDLFAQSIPSEPVTKKNEKIDGALVATNLATLRKLNHLSLSEEASIAEVSKRTIIHYERGDSAPSFDVLDRLLSHFNVTPSLFFYSVLKSPEVSPTVLSEKPKSKKKWLIPVIVLLLIALATGITVPLVLQNQKAQKVGDQLFGPR
jgi:transcriptional regulator with XRE-family HTH domain